MLSPVTLFLSVLALVVGERPLRTGLWFYLGAFGVTLLVGVVAAFGVAGGHETWISLFWVKALSLRLKGVRRA